MSQISLLLIVLLIGMPLVSGQESERRRVVRSEALWPEFDAGVLTRGVQLGLRGLGTMEPESAARAELATAIFNAMLASGNLNAAGAWLQQEPSLKQTCTAWAKLALTAARHQNREVWSRAKAEAERLAPISSLREGRAGWVLLYEAVLLVKPEDAERSLQRVASDDFESQSALKAIKIRRIVEGLDEEVDERAMIALLSPPATQASLDLMAYALRLVEVLSGGGYPNEYVSFSAVAGQAVKCAIESAANPAPVLVSVLAEAERSGEQLPMLDEWFERATKSLAMANLDEMKPSYLLEMAKVAEQRGELDRQSLFFRASETTLRELEPALQPEGFMRFGETYVKQGEPVRAWQIWRELLDQLEHNPNRDLRFQMCCKIALEIDRWTGDKADLKARAFAELEALVGGIN